MVSGGAGNILTPSLQNQLTAIKRTQRAMDITTLRLATGRRVNSAVDNPQNFFSALALSNRADDLIRIQDSIQQSIRTVQGAIAGTNALERLLNQAEAVALNTLEEIQAGISFPDLSFVEDDTVFPTTPLNEIIQGDSPVAYYRLNESSGQAIEASGNPQTFDASYVGGVTQGAGALYSNGGTGSADFDGVTGRVVVPNSNLINSPGPGNQRTVELDFNADTTAGRQVLYEEGGTVNGYTIYIDNGSLYFTAEDDAGGLRFADLDINVPIQAGTTYHAAFVFDRFTQTFTGYLNGEEVGQASVNNDVFPNHPGGIGIGAINGDVQFHDGEASGTTGFFFNGRISDVAIYNTAISEGGMRQRYESLELNIRNTEFDNIINQIDTIIEDTNYRGINLLAGDDLKTFFNEDRNNSLVTEGVNFDFRSLGIERTQFNIREDVEGIIAQVREAREQVRSYGRTLSTDLSIIQTRQRSIEDQVNTLESGSDDLTIADQNKEGADLLALQVRQQLQFAALGAPQVSIADFLL